MSTLLSNSNRLESLVRTALLNSELAPGVAKQISVYRTTILSGNEKRLLAILDDAIAEGFITVVKPPLQSAIGIKPAIKAPVVRTVSPMINSMG